MQKKIKKKIAIYPFIDKDGIGTYLNGLCQEISYDKIKSRFHPLSPIQFLTPLITKYDIIHVPNFYVPLICNSKIICTIQDITPILDKKLFNSIIRLYIRIRISWSLIRSSHIIFTSNFTKNETLKSFPFVKKFTVIPLGLETNYNLTSKHKKKIEKFDYFLLVGRQKHNKNFKRVFNAFSKIALINNLHIVIVGNPESIRDQIKKLTSNKDVINRVHIRGKVSTECLINYYKNAIALVYVSIYEGFGLPILEAMHHGCPVITSNTSSMPEVSGKAAYLVNPYEENEIAKSMQIINKDLELRTKLKKEGLRQIKKFPLAETIRKTNEIINSID